MRELEPLQSVLARAKQLLSEQQLRMRTVCALARNHFSRERLQADFREGIAEVGVCKYNWGIHLMGVAVATGLTVNGAPPPLCATKGAFC